MRLTLLELIDCGPFLNTVKDLANTIKTLISLKPKCVDPIHTIDHPVLDSNTPILYLARTSMVSATSSMYRGNGPF